MSVATAFKYHRPFPFCPAAFDIDAIDLTTISPNQFFIRDLTLADAMKLYWSLESVEIEFSASGVGFYIPSYPSPGTGTGEMAMTINLNTVANAPRARVCDDFASGGSEGISDELVTNAATTINYDDLGTPADIFDSTLLYSAPYEFLNPETIVTIQDDGKYTFWFLMYESTSPIAMGGGGTLTETYNPDPTNFDYVDISVLSGTLRIHGVAFNNTGVFEYTGGGTLGTVTFTPSFFTFA